MALQDITNKIIDDARKEAERIESDAVAEAKRIMRDMEKMNKAYERQSDKETALIIEKREQAALSRIRREVQQIINARKRALVDAVLSNAQKHIAQSDESVYESFCKSIIDAVSTDVRAHVKQVRVPRSRVDFMRTFCKKEGITGDIVADDTIDAGMILVTDTVDYDGTLGRRLADMKYDLEAYIARTLFNEQCA